MQWNIFVNTAKRTLRIELTYQPSKLSFSRNFHVLLSYLPFGYCPIIRIDFCMILWKKWHFFLNFISYHIFAIYVGGASLGLSHTWVRHPGFSGHGVKCPILTTVVPGFSSALIGCTIRSKWGSFGDLYLARKNRLCLWNKLFLAEIKFSQRRTRAVKSLWWQIVHM